VIWSC